MRLDELQWNYPAGHRRAPLPNGQGAVWQGPDGTYQILWFERLPGDHLGAYTDLDPIAAQAILYYLLGTKKSGEET